MEALLRQSGGNHPHNRITFYFATTLVVLFVFFFSIHLNAQPLPVDYFTYKSKISGKTYVELYLKIDNSRLQFVKNQGIFETDVTVTVYLFDRLETKVLEKSFTKKFICTDFTATINPRLNQVFLFPFRLAPGHYRALIQIEDKHAPRQMIKKIELNVPDYYDGSFHLSSVLISAEEGGRVDGKGIPYIGSALAPSHHDITVYFEAYNVPEVKDGLLTRIEFRNEQGVCVRSFAQQVRAGQHDPAFSLRLSLRDLPPGKYHLAVTQSCENPALQATSEKQIAVIQSPIDLRFKKYEDALKELRFVATEDQINQLKKVPIDQRQEALNRFWKSKDPTPLTTKNEIFEEYYGRIENANRLFTNGGLPGWKSDFGLVYILFGPPDQIVVEKSEFSYMEQQVWLYRRLGLSFTFLNRNRFDDFMLLDKGYIMANYLPH